MSNKRSATAVAKNKPQVKKAVELKETENIVPIKEQLPSKNDAFKQTIDILRSDILSMIGIMSTNPEYTTIREQLIQIDSSITKQLFKTYNLDLEFIPIGSVNKFLNVNIVKPLNKIKIAIFQVERDWEWNDIKDKLLVMIDKTIQRVLVDGKWVNFLNEKEKVDVIELDKLDPMFGKIIKARKNTSIDLKFCNDTELGPNTPRRVIENDGHHSPKITSIEDTDKITIGQTTMTVKEARELIPSPYENYPGKLWLDSITVKKEEKKEESTEKFIEKTEEWIDKNTKKEDNTLIVPKEWNENPDKPISKTDIDSATNESDTLKNLKIAQDILNESKEEKPRKTSLIQKWAPILECEIGEPIKSQKIAAVIASLLENQTKLNKGYLPESIQVAKDLQIYQQYALPLIRRNYLNLLAFKVTSIIPTTTPSAIWKVYRYDESKSDFIQHTGAVIVSTRRIECNVLSDGYNNMRTNNSLDESTDSLELMTLKYTSLLDSELVDAMIYCATNKNLGGTNESLLYINEVDVASKILDQAKNIKTNTHMGYGNFVICSSDIIDKLTGSKYYIQKYVNNFLVDAPSSFYEVGTLLKENINITVIKDTRDHIGSYSLVGYNGKEPGHSGIQFIPYIPYYFTRTETTIDMKDGTGVPMISDSPDENTKVSVNTSYAMVSNIPDSGLFYRYNLYTKDVSAEELDKEENDHYSDIMKTCIKEVETLEIILLNKVDNGSVSKEKIKEIITPLYRHALLVLGFHYARGNKLKDVGQYDDSVFKDRSEVSLVESSLDILANLEKLYTTDLLTDCVSIGRVHEILTPIKKHANLIMGMYSYKNKNDIKQPEYIILSELPEVGETFSQAINCSDSGEFIATYHNIIINHKSSFCSGFSAGDGNLHGGINKSNLNKNWKFVK